MSTRKKLAALALALASCTASVSFAAADGIALKCTNRNHGGVFLVGLSEDRTSANAIYISSHGPNRGVATSLSAINARVSEDRDYFRYRTSDSNHELNRTSLVLRTSPLSGGIISGYTCSVQSDRSELDQAVNDYTRLLQQEENRRRENRRRADDARQI